MEPHLAVNDQIMFYRYLNNATVYFEYGSGGSTYQATIRDNIVRIYTVESDKYWLHKVQQYIDSDKVVFFYNEMDTFSDTWGKPGPESTITQRRRYSNYILQLPREEQLRIDLVLIDGRFRVACCLKCFNVITSECLIAFDDFLNRKQYHVVLDYFDIIDKTTDNRMVILRKKALIYSIPDAIVKKYELISA